MNRMRSPLCRGGLILLLALELTALRTTAQEPPETFSHPATSFSAEDDKFRHAVALPECVRRYLERAMEKASGRDLKTLFDEAVYH